MAVAFRISQRKCPIRCFQRCQVHGLESPGLRVARSFPTAHAIVVEFKPTVCNQKATCVNFMRQNGGRRAIWSYIRVTTCLSPVGSGLEQPDCFWPSHSRLLGPPSPVKLQAGRKSKRGACGFPQIYSGRMRHTFIGPGRRQQRASHKKSRWTCVFSTCMGVGWPGYVAGVQRQRYRRHRIYFRWAFDARFGARTALCCRSIAETAQHLARQHLPCLHVFVLCARERVRGRWLARIRCKRAQHGIQEV